MGTTAPASKLGRYRVHGHLAAGGMAEILLASIDGPGGFRKLVVLKRILPHLAGRTEFRRMFLDEARIVAALRHPNVVQVIELAREDDDLFLVMEYLEGESLQRVLHRIESASSRIAPELAAHVIAAAAAGLHAAHESTTSDGSSQQLVHRDVSPHNLVITYDGSVKVIDFGVAKAADRYASTSTGQIKGKYGYMSPEQCLARDVDRRTDVFALGVVLWEASTGQRLFRRENEMRVLKAVCEDEIPRPSTVVPDYPPVLERVVMRALERDLDARYPTAAELRRDLLAAAREIRPSADLDSELSSLMHATFPDRIAQKTDLSRAISAGSTVGSLEWFDASTGAALGEPQPRSGLRASAKVASAARRVPWAGLAVAFTALGITASWWAIQRTLAPSPVSAIEQPSAPAPAPSPSVVQAPPSPVETTPRVEEATEPERAPSADDTHTDDTPRPEEASRLEETPEAPARLVTIQIDSSPTGADVRVDGHHRGRTPVVVELPASDAAVDVTLSHGGFETITEQVVPDVDQRLRLVLVRTRSPNGHDGFERFD